MSIVPKIKYLTNKDLLSAIHESKNTFCEYLDKKYATFDIIVYDLSVVTPEMIQAARQKRLNVLIAEEKKASGSKLFESKKTIDEIAAEDIVVRLMTFEHVPINPAKEGKAKTVAEKHIRCNFPPFQHYIFEDDQWRLVGKSHWEGGLQNGAFSLIHGKVTNRLAAMWMKLVERYGHRGNWRGYCVDTQTEALTHRGWLNYEQLTTDDIILSYSIDEKKLKWSKIKSIFRDHYTGNMFKMTVTGMDALVTPGHKFVTQDGLKEVEYLNDQDELIISASTDEDLPEDVPVVFQSIKVSDIDFHGGKMTLFNVPTVPYDDMVWCPQTEYGTFVARRNGYIYVTSNTYVDEMKAQALVQLAQVGLQFDEAKSSNPFAYYTQVSSTSFLKILNLEKRNQHIRDDMLIMAGATPSSTRQVENQLEQQALADVETHVIVVPEATTTTTSDDDSTQ